MQNDNTQTPDMTENRNIPIQRSSNFRRKYDHIKSRTRQELIKLAKEQNITVRVAAE